MNKTNIIAVLLLLAAAGTAMAEMEYESSVILEVNTLSECYAAGVPIVVTVEVDDPNGTCDMDSLIVTANFTGCNISEQVTLVGVECVNGDNCMTMNFTGNVTIDVSGVEVTCYVVTTDPSGECANHTHVFQMMGTIAPIVIDGYCHKHNMMIGTRSYGVYDLSATCYDVCGNDTNCTNVEWSCSCEHVATIHATTGELVAHHAGVATVNATCGDTYDAVDIVVDAKPSFCNMTGHHVTGVVTLGSGGTTLVVDFGDANSSTYVQEIGDPVDDANCGDINCTVVKGAHVYALAHDNGNTSNYTYTLTMCYNVDNVAGLGIDVGTLTVLMCNGTSWVAVGDVDNEDGCVTVGISGNGTYALVGTAQTEDDEDNATPVDNNRGGSSRDGTYPPEPFDDDSDDSDSDSDDTDDAVVIDDAVVVPDPVDIPDVVETPTTENTLDADIEHPDDDGGVNTLWLFAGIVAIIVAYCAITLYKRRT